jgi:hypothetical protein
MMRWIGCFLPFVATTALLGCAELHPSGPTTAAADPAVSAQPAPIDPAAVQALYAVPHREEGTVLHGSHQGAQWTKWAKPDGSLELLAGHGLFADTGKFVIRGNMLCSTWGHIDGGHEHCVQLVRVSADEYVTYAEDGTEGSRFQVRPP